MFSTDKKSGVPIYLQLIEQVIAQIDRGKIEPGDRLPSVRNLAEQLGVNPMTVSKAYSILEADSVVHRKRGVGMIVIKKADKPAELLGPLIKQLINEARELGLDRRQLDKMIRGNWE